MPTVDTFGQAIILRRRGGINCEAEPRLFHGEAEHISTRSPLNPRSQERLKRRAVGECGGERITSQAPWLHAEAERV
jgi:hypothetical protein